MKDPKELFFLLSDDTRFRVVMLLQGQGELCVCELVAALALIQPKISRHLAVLRDAGLVTDHRDGVRVFYRLAESLPRWVCEIISLAHGQAGNATQHKADLKRLRSMTARPTRREVA